MPERIKILDEQIAKISDDEEIGRTHVEGAGEDGIEILTNLHNPEDTHES